MRFKLILVLTVFMVSACTFQVDILDAPQPSEVVLTTPTTSPTILIPSSSATPPPFPTDSSTPLPPNTPVLATFPSVAALPVVFSANGTFQDIAGNVGTGSKQTYSLNAFQGQIMSVSILPEQAGLQDTFQLEIKGRDGVVLCPIQGAACPFWRGALPSTQEYLITVNPQEGGAYTMRIAINPPGTVSQLFRYFDPQGRFALSHPDDFAPVHYTGVQVTKIPPEFSLQYIDTEQYASTNLGEVYFLIGLSDDPQQVSTCTQPLSFGGPESILGEITINGINFTKSQVEGHAAGNIYEQVYYRTPYHGSCYEVTYFVHYGSIGAYAPGTVEEFDRTALYQELDGILATFVLQ